MKIRTFLLKLCFIISMFILIFPVFLGIFYNFKNILYVLKYQESVREGNFSNVKSNDEIFRKDFLEKTCGVFGVINFCDLNIKSAVYYDKKNECFSGNFFNNCIIINVKNNCFFENFFSRLEELNVRDVFDFSVFGTRKKFEVEEVKTVFKFDESIYCRNGYDGLIITLDVPYGINCNRLLIKAKYVGGFEEELDDLFSLFCENQFLVVVAVLIFIFLFIYLLTLILKFVLRKKRNVVRIKYVVKKNC